MNILQIYSPESHLGAFILANEKGLLDLKCAIDEAIKNHRSKVNFFCVDGKEYDLEIIKQTSEQLSEFAVEPHNL